MVGANRIEATDTARDVPLAPGDRTHRPTIDSGPMSVYHMRMARVNVYLPDDLAREARAAGLNVSSLTQDALRRALAAGKVDRWLEGVASMRPTGLTRKAVASAIAGAKNELEGDG